jgi:hypothetical protein
MRTSIPIDIITLETGSYHLVVSGRLNGCRCNVLLDTGASQTVFDRSLVTELPEDEQPDIQSAGVIDGDLATSAGIIHRFELGALALIDWRVIAIDLTHLQTVYSNFTDKRVIGLIGSDFLLEHEAVINYGKHRLTLMKI